MAQTVVATASITFVTSTLPQVARKPGAVTVTVTGTQYFGGVQSIGTSEEALDLGDMGALTLGWFYAKNLDGTNFVDLRMGTGAADMVRLKAGETCLFRLAGNTPWATADTAACELDYLIIED